MQAIPKMHRNYEIQHFSNKISLAQTEFYICHSYQTDLYRLQKSFKLQSSSMPHKYPTSYVNVTNFMKSDRNKLNEI